MNKQKLQHTLHELAGQSTAPGRDLWPEIRRRAEQASRLAAWRQGLPLLPRWGWVGIALAALLLFSASAYAVSPVVSRLFRMDEQLKNADPASPGQALELSQTIGGVTVMLQWAYADRERILIGYTIRSLDGKRYDPHGELSDETTGAVYESAGGYGVVGQSDILKVNLPPGEGAYIDAFPQCPEAGQAPDEKSAAHCFPIRQNAAGATGAPQTLSLHFTVRASEFLLPEAQATPANSNLPPDSQTSQAQPAAMGPAVGPFTFDFSIPLSAAKK